MYIFIKTIIYSENFIFSVNHAKVLMKLNGQNVYNSNFNLMSSNLDTALSQISDLTNLMKSSKHTTSLFVKQNHQMTFYNLEEKWSNFHGSTESDVINFIKHDNSSVLMINECLIDPANELYGSYLTKLLNLVTKEKKDESIMRTLMEIIRKLGSFSPISKNKTKPPYKENLKSFKSNVGNMSLFALKTKRKLTKIIEDFIKHEPVFSFAYDVHEKFQGIQDTVKNLQEPQKSYQQAPPPPPPSRQQISKPPPPIQPVIPQIPRAPPPAQPFRPQIPKPPIQPQIKIPPKQPNVDQEALRKKAIEEYRKTCKENMEKKVEYTLNKKKKEIQAKLEKTNIKIPDGFTNDLSELETIYQNKLEECNNLSSSYNELRKITQSLQMDDLSGNQLQLAMLKIKMEIQDIIDQQNQQEKDIKKEFVSFYRISSCYVSHLIEFNSFVKQTFESFNMDFAVSPFTSSDSNDVKDFNFVFQNYQELISALNTLYNEKTE